MASETQSSSLDVQTKAAAWLADREPHGGTWRIMRGERVFECHPAAADLELLLKRVSGGEGLKGFAVGRSLKTHSAFHSSRKLYYKTENTAAPTNIS